MANNTNSKKYDVWISILTLFGFGIAWEWGPSLFEIPPYIIPSASSVFTEFIHAIDNERLFYHTGITLLETIAGFIVGSLLGMVIGYVLGVSPKDRAKGCFCAVVCRLVWFYGLSENSGGCFDRVLPDHGQCAQRGPNC